jgi:hypothetical protein
MEGPLADLMVGALADLMAGATYDVTGDCETGDCVGGSASGRPTLWIPKTSKGPRSLTLPECITVWCTTLPGKVTIVGTNFKNYKKLPKSLFS